MELEEEVPSFLWGLDPVFSASARMYIKDIQEMKESKQVPGIFFYNRHPIRQVDVLGTVVLTKERDAFHMYGVDDGTGVISCICWKNPSAEQKSLSDYDSNPSTSSSLDLVEQMRKLQEVVRLKSRLDIGDVVRVRGCVRTYRQKREISASIYYKIDDPICEAQISRMLELPHLYREIYDKTFHLPEERQSGPGSAAMLGSITVLSEKIMDFLSKNKTQNFYQQELETVASLVSLIKQCGPSTATEHMDFKADLNSKLIRSSFTEAINVLQEKGALFQKSKNPNDVYCVTKQDNELYRVTLEIIKADCKRPKYAEKGCHLRHILSCVQQNYSCFVTEPVIRYLLDLMESNSDVVTTMEEYYTVF
ncbi:CST complex subunit STN1 [Heteronotia binoei]|uniref:CST complex subunit STN1 n=1 Tax=Heteronotia binoei TaxID=13085 RepID=UPI0029307652|nr:CST complex subunit STN1 [Heteronotia binoei]XP_060097700.1 CST complex subunit STN1 [Heteronotia binoei]